MGDKFVPVDDGLYASVSIGTYAFPFQIFHDDLEHYSHQFVNWHQQKVIELSVMLDGEAEVQVLEQRMTVEKGEGFLIFPDALHTIRRGRSPHTRYITFIFDPKFLYGYKGSFLYKKYYRPYVSSQKPLYKLPHQSRWETDVFEELQKICRDMESETEELELRIYQRLQKIWLILCKHLFLSEQEEEQHKKNQEQITSMIQYFHRHYQEKFSLTALAGNFHISRGECCRFFKKMLGMSPMEYLQEYRLQKAIELLEDTNWNITEIAELTGFSTVSYFITFFKNKTGDTPLRYRQKQK